MNSWYQIQELQKNLFRIHEPDHCDFYLIKEDGIGTFVDTGLGLNDNLAHSLLSELSIDEFSVLNTHTHCDHIGLNHMANSCYMSYLEWNNFASNNRLTLKYYYDRLSSSMQWPENIENISRSMIKWKPTDYVVDNETLKTHPAIRSLILPGHTAGHTCYLNEEKKIAFLGDMIYDGALYLHLKDSDLKNYVFSLNKLISHLAASDLQSWNLYPSHNSVPLNPEYLLTVKETLQKIISGEIAPIGESIGDEVFDDAYLYLDGNVKIYIKKTDMSYRAELVSLRLVTNFC